jgi:hypothetical protein
VPKLANSNYLLLVFETIIFSGSFLQNMYQVRLSVTSTGHEGLWAGGEWRYSCRAYQAVQ